MRALGFTAWRRQTVAGVEKNTRRVTAEELLGLALALETSLMSLIEPSAEDGPIGLPSGAPLLFVTVHALIWGGSEYTVRWEGDAPIFPAEPPAAWPTYSGDYVMPPPRVWRGWDEKPAPSPSTNLPQDHEPRIVKDGGNE